MRGHVPTPEAVVAEMVRKLFHRRRPRVGDIVLDPGCGTGPFIAGIIEYCERLDVPPPRIIGIELDPKYARAARERFSSNPSVTILEADFLTAPLPRARFVIGNPPYVPITALTAGERDTYRRRFAAAQGRFDLYWLFFERAIELLEEGGRLCFITPEKFEYVEGGSSLRQLLAENTIVELQHLAEDTFPGYVTYPTVSVIVRSSKEPQQETRVIHRSGAVDVVKLPRDGSSWQHSVSGGVDPGHTLTLMDVVDRVSCGIATGADSVYVQREAGLHPGLLEFAYPTLAGRQIPPGSNSVPPTKDVMLIPYSEDGRLLPPDELGALYTYLSRPDIKRRLSERSCVGSGGKPWYAFHDSAPLQEILNPKILCKDISAEPEFLLDLEGRIVPRHSVYYIIPKRGVVLPALHAYLNSEEARNWLRANCQRAARGYYRIQSSVLKRLPVPAAILGAKGSPSSAPKMRASPRQRLLV
ncbi:MAG TPA: N-6 DNA methylase [Candidatus Thermoplasmatota archaeon]|nr:N-6 DNA methylase [Candidatus Thermoplasmatota archaeon]